MGNTKSRIDSESLDTKKFSHFSPEDLKEWSAHFKTLFPSGIMRKEDLCMLLHSFFPFGNAEKFSETLFQTINISQSDAIDFNELLIGFSIICKGSRYERLRWIFRFYDKDKDGIVSREEIRECIEDFLEMTKGMVGVNSEAFQLIDDIFKKLENESGFITFNDFERLSRTKTTKTNKNKNVIDS